jgi:hypothetical protein
MMRGFMHRHRLALVLAAVALLFFILGATAPHTAMPLMCKIYG